MKKSEPLRTVLVGCGAVSTVYYSPALELLQKSGVIRVVGLVDPNGESLARIARKFPQASRFDAIFEISQKHAELAIIASPPRFHAEQTIGLLQAGLSVLCEKPMATNVAEGKAMVEAASSARGILAVGLGRRFFPATQTIRDILFNGMLGEIASFRFTECNDFRWPVASTDFFRSGEGRGGVLLDIGVHALDLLLWWWGQPDEIIYEDDAMGGVEANCRITLHFKRGFSGEIRLSRDWSLPSEYLVQGKRGWLRWEVNDAEHLQIGTNDNPYTLGVRLYEKTGRSSELRRPAANFHQSFVNQLRNVVDAIRNRTRPLVGGEEGMQSIKLIEHCYNQKRWFAMPWFSGADRNRAIQLRRSI